MNAIRFIILAALAAVLSGCASKTIESASTKLQVTDAQGRGLTFVFPKELDAKDFDLSVDPSTSKIHLKSSAITTSSTGVIDSAGRAQAQAMSDVAKTLDTVVSTVLPIVAPAAAPLVKKPAAQDTPATEDAE